jgi:hypothetical protein
VSQKWGSHQNNVSYRKGNSDSVEDVRKQQAVGHGGRLYLRHRSNGQPVDSFVGIVMRK